MRIFIASLTHSIENITTRTTIRNSDTKHRYRIKYTSNDPGRSSKTREVSGESLRRGIEVGELVWQMDTTNQRVMGQIVHTSTDHTKENSIRVRLKSDGMEYDYQHADVKTETGLCGLYGFFFLSKLCDFSFRCLLLLLLLRRGLAGTTWQQNILSVKSVRLCMTHSLTHVKPHTHNNIESQVSKWESQPSTAESYQ